MPDPFSRSIGDVLARQLPAPRREPPKCPRCGGLILGCNIGTDDAPRIVYLSTHCDACVTAIRSEERATAKQRADEAHQRRLESAWKSFGPEGQENDEGLIYRDVQHSRLPRRDKADEILKWQPKNSTGKGLMIHGASGRGKTFMVYLLAKHLMEKHGITPILYTAPGLRHAFNRAARSEDSARRDALLDRLIAAPVVIIDDLGQSAMTEAAEEMLWELIEGRTSRKKPIVITTQFCGQLFIDRFRTTKTGESVFRRLAQFCQEIAT